MSSISQSSQANRFVIWLRDKTAIDLIFLLLAGSISFFLISLLSFDPFDNTAYSVSFPKFSTQNLGGTIGANISGFFIYYFGAVSYFFPIPALFYACRTLLTQDYRFHKMTLAGWLCVYISATWIIQKYDPYFFLKGVELPSAGAFGIYFTSLTTQWLGKTGSLIFVMVLSLSGATLVLHRSFLNLGFTRVRYLPGAIIGQLKKIRKIQAEFAAEPESITPPLTPMADEIFAEEKKTAAPKLGILSGLIKPKLPTVEVAPKVSTKTKPAKKKSATASEYSFPPMTVLNKSPHEFTTKLQYDELEKTGELLVETLSEFGVKGILIAVKPGPVVTVFEFQPDAGVKQSKVMSLVDDLALALHVDAILINPVTDKRALGIQVPNKKRKLVSLGDVIDSPSFENSESHLTFAMGESLSGDPVITDISAMPHLLVAGATGSGKSVAVNTLLCSILMKSSPEDVRMILVDPKMLELSIYEGIPHLLMPVITEPHRAGATLKWAVVEMERRYKLMQLARVRNIAGFNEFWESASEEERTSLATEVTQYIKEDFEVCRLPLILIVIDELADLMLTAPKEIETLIQRLAQKARASGIHLVLATQRPSVDIITGVIKANLPCRAAFQVVSKHDSRTILDQMGAEKLLGKGDMLLQRPGVNRLERIQGAFVSDKEVIDLVQYIKTHASPADYDDKLIEWVDRNAQSESEESDFETSDGEQDEKYDMATEIARQQGHISASFLQRQLKIGYNRAARIVETMERQGLIGAPEGSKPRPWLGNV